MNVKELIDLLYQCDPNALVVLSSDEEGNGYRTAYSVAVNNVFTEDDEVKLKVLTPDLEELGYGKEDVGEGQDCIVIY